MPYEEPRVSGFSAMVRAERLDGSTLGSGWAIFHRFQLMEEDEPAEWDGYAEVTLDSTMQAVGSLGLPFGSVGVTPSSTWRVGDPLGRVAGRPDQRVTKDSGWQLKIGPRRTIDMPSLLAELVTLVAPRLDAIEATVAELSLAVDVGLHVKMVDQAPIGTIDHQTLAFLARLHAELDLDLYVVGANYDEPLGQGGTH